MELSSTPGNARAISRTALKSIFFFAMVLGALRPFYGCRFRFTILAMHPTEPWRYEKLTWPEINDAAKQKKPVVVPIGSIEQHGPHLPLDVDMLEVTAVAQAAARLIPNDVLVLPTQVNGYTGHVMDFPGTINIHFETLIRFMIDIGKSLAYHGFKKILFINGHGSNAPNMDLAARRVNLETDAEAIACNWWSM